MNGFRWAFLFWLAGGLPSAEYTPCGCDCNTPTIETPEIEDLIERIYIQHLIYYPEEITTIIIYKI